MQTIKTETIRTLQNLSGAACAADNAVSAVIAAHIAAVDADNDKSMATIVESMQVAAKTAHKKFMTAYKTVRADLDDDTAEQLHLRVFGK